VNYASQIITINFRIIKQIFLLLLLFLFLPILFYPRFFKRKGKKDDGLPFEQLLHFIFWTWAKANITEQPH
jgi:hypothetical protein